MQDNVRFVTANDNQPLRAYPIAVNTRFAGTPRPAPREFVRHIPAAQSTLSIDETQSKKSNKSKMMELTAIGGILAFVCAIIAGLTLSGTNLNISDIAGLLSITALGFAGLMHSRLALITSCLASLIWVGCSFAGVASPSIFFYAFPAIWSVQIYLASRVKSRLAIIVGNVSGYYWFIGHGLAFMAAGAISPVMALSGLFLTGIVHYRGGKAAEDEATFGHEIHTYFGWFMAMVGAIFITHYWLFPDNILWLNMKSTAMGSLGWKLATTLGIAAVYLSMMVRWKHYRVTAKSAVVMTVLCALLPITLWFEDSVRGFVDAVPGLTSSPTVGILIAVSVITAGVGLAVNGVRRSRVMMILLGLVAAGAQGLMLINPGLITFENVAVLLTGFLVSASTAALLAGENLTQFNREPEPYRPPALAA